MKEKEWKFYSDFKMCLSEKGFENVNINVIIYAYSCEVDLM